MKSGDLGTRSNALNYPSLYQISLEKVMKSRQIDSLPSAREVSVGWMQKVGYPGAVLQRGSGNSLDLRATAALGRVMVEPAATDTPALQLLVGARGAQYHLHLCCFANAGYTSAAVKYAEELRISLFKYTLDGSLVAANRLAHEQLDNRVRTTNREDSNGWSPYTSPSAAAAVVVTPPMPVTLKPGGWFRRSLRWLGRLVRTAGWEAFRSDEANRPSDLMSAGQLVSGGVGVGVFGLVAVISMLTTLGGPGGVGYSLGGAAMYSLVVGFGAWAIVLGQRRKVKEAAARNPNLANPTEMR